MITVRDVSHRYDKQVVLDEVGLTLPTGQLTSIVGANGAGKSTLLSVISRLIKPESGSVFIDDLDVQSAGDDAVAKRLAVLRQDNRITARLSVVDLARFGRFPYSKGRLTPEDHVIVDEALDYLDLQPLRDRYLDQLSGGQRQRAYIAMILAQDTDYILLDEPLNNLDMKHSSSMMTLLRRAADDLGKTIVLVLHDINFASCFSDHIVAMRDGKVVVQGTPAQIMHRQTLREVFDMDIHVQDLNGVRLGIFWTTGAPVGPTPGFGEPATEPEPVGQDALEPVGQDAREPGRDGREPGQDWREPGRDGHDALEPEEAPSSESHDARALGPVAARR